MPELIIRKSKSTDAEGLLKQSFTPNDEGTLYFTADQKIFLNTILDGEKTENQIVQYGGDVIYDNLSTSYNSNAQLLTLKTIDGLKTIYPQSQAHLIFREDGSSNVELSLETLESKAVDGINGEYSNGSNTYKLFTVTTAGEDKSFYAPKVTYSNSVTASSTTKIGAVSFGGSSLGDIKIPKMSATQTLTSGTEVGKVTIGDTTTTFYAPTPPSNYVAITGNQNITGQKTFSSAVTISNQTASESTATGALTVSGGIGCAGNIYGKAVYGAVYNDYAEYRKSSELKPGLCICENGNGELSISKERLQPGANIISDTFGFAIGETDECKTPIAVSGRVLVYPYENKEEYKPGDAVCSGPNGTISKMTREEIREYPERIVGTVSEIPTYETWGTNKVQVDGRIWIKVK